MVAEAVEEGGETCASCYLQYLPESFFALGCEHAFCLNCTRDHLQTRIVDGKAMKIPCMHFQCKQMFQAEHI